MEKAGDAGTLWLLAVRESEKREPKLSFDLEMTAFESLMLVELQHHLVNKKEKVGCA